MFPLPQMKYYWHDGASISRCHHKDVRHVWPQALRLNLLRCQTGTFFMWCECWFLKFIKISSDASSSNVRGFQVKWKMNVKYSVRFPSFWIQNSTKPYCKCPRVEWCDRNIPIKVQLCEYVALLSSCSVLSWSLEGETAFPEVVVFKLHIFQEPTRTPIPHHIHAAVWHPTTELLDAVQLWKNIY